MTLSELPQGVQAQIARIEFDQQEDTALLEMGLLPGTEVSLAYRSPLGDPIVVRLGRDNYQLSLRKADAARIEVKMA